MKAIDTNILVRVVTRDDPEQFAAAAEVMKAGSLWVAKTVLLETAWVLQFAYRLPREVCLDALRRIVGYENLTVEDNAGVLRALAWAAQGMEFADALHLASAGECEEFVTFDRKFVSKAGEIEEGVPVRFPVTRAR